MIITDFLEKNARLYGHETALVAINTLCIFADIIYL